jgi:hypothetical protein
LPHQGKILTFLPRLGKNFMFFDPFFRGKIFSFLPRLGEKFSDFCPVKEIFLNKLDNLCYFSNRENGEKRGKNHNGTKSPKTGHLPRNGVTLGALPSRSDISSLI